MSEARFVRLSWDAPPEQLRLSPVLAETIARWTAERGSTAVVIRHQRPYVLLGPKDRRLPNLDAAVSWLNSQDYPVFMRIGGGSAVLLDENCLSFAISQPCRDFTVWEANFRTMAQPIIDGLALLRIKSQFGRAVGSYCEGPYDLVAREQKIAGIAQAIRGGYALVSGMLLIRQNPETTTALLQEFYRRAGSDLVLNPRAVTSLNQLPGMESLTTDRVEDALYRGFEAHYHLIEEPLSDDEVALAEILMGERRFPPMVAIPNR